MNELDKMYSEFDDMYKKLKAMKERFEDIKKLSEQADKEVEEMRHHHEEEAGKIFKALEKRDEEIRNYLERKEQYRINHLLGDMGNLIDEMFDVRLRILDKRYNKENI